MKNSRWNHLIWFTFLSSFSAMNIWAARCSDFRRYRSRKLRSHLKWITCHKFACWFPPRLKESKATERWKSKEKLRVSWKPSWMRSIKKQENHANWISEWEKTYGAWRLKFIRAAAWGKFIYYATFYQNLFTTGLNLFVYFPDFLASENANEGSLMNILD